MHNQMAMISSRMRIEERCGSQSDERAMQSAALPDVAQEGKLESSLSSRAVQQRSRGDVRQLRRARWRRSRPRIAETTPKSGICQWNRNDSVRPRDGFTIRGGHLAKAERP